MVKSITKMQTEIYVVNRKNGWAGPDAPEVSFPEAMMLLITEVSEAVEAYRSWGLEDATAGDDIVLADNVPIRMPKPEGVGSEFADILIRLLDDCERFGIDLEAEYERKMAYNRTRSFRHGDKRI